MTVEDATVEYKGEIFTFLDELRKTGVCNMFGAGTCVQDEFDMDKRDAREWVKLWMKEFSHA